MFNSWSKPVIIYVPCNLSLEQWSSQRWNADKRWRSTQNLIKTVLHPDKTGYTVMSLYNDCFGSQDTVRIQRSECSDWLPIALSLHQGCPYIECPYKEKLLYLDGEG